MSEGYGRRSPAPGAPMKPNWLMIATTYVTRQAYLKFAIRVRQWGHLPAKRGAAVLITNHQHIDEGEMITARTFLLHPWKPLTMCNSRRTYETGFIATVWPRSVRLTRGLNLSWLWDCLSILPIENHLFSRPLISLAEELRAAHGDLALDAILPAETLAPLKLDGCVLSDLWKLANFTPAHAWVKVAQLKQPYRREVLENLRSVTKRDIAAIVERVRAGATFYITPEGDFSRDGRMHPMRKRNHRRALALCRPLALRGRLRSFPRPTALDALSRRSIRRRRRYRDVASCGAADHDLGALGGISARWAGNVRGCGRGACGARAPRLTAR